MNSSEDFEFNAESILQNNSEHILIKDPFNELYNRIIFTSIYILVFIISFFGK